MAIMNVALLAPMKAWVEERRLDGSCANSSDYVRDLIRKDQERPEGSAEFQALNTQVRRTTT